MKRGIEMSRADYERHQQKHGFQVHQTIMGAVPEALKPPRRQKQPNKTEAQMHEILVRRLGVINVIFEGVTLRLADNCRYTPDFFCTTAGRPLIVEVKGGHVWDDSIVKFKVAKQMHESWADFEFWQKIKGTWTWVH
jgi:hypothetical protein